VKVLYRFEEFDPAAGCAVTVGVFDGLHLGHRRLVQETLAAARAHQVPSCVVTFRNHPREVLGRGTQDLITSLEHRLVLLERAGLDVAIATEFTDELGSLTAERFVCELLRGRLGARALVLGSDARMGRSRSADSAQVAAIARSCGIEPRIVPPVVVNGQIVSSTAVRERIRAGDLAAAEALLGRRVSVLGTVVPGDGRGRRLGFPTANLDVQREVRPPYGVYATVAVIAGERLPSVTNVGFRPTFEPEMRSGLRRDRLIETHLLRPPTGEIYGRTMEVEFVAKIRDERRFGTDAELAGQIAHDVESARALLAREGLS